MVPGRQPSVDGRERRLRALHGMLETGEQLYDVGGFPLIIRPESPDLTVAKSCFGGEFEPLRFLLPREYAGLIVDAGGYIGTSAIALGLMFPKAQIAVIEPSDENLKVLRKNLWGFPNCQIFHGALVGSQTETIPLKNRGTGQWGFSVVKTPEDNPEADVIQESRAFTLPQLLGTNQKIGLLKLDIEGGEFDLLTNDMDSVAEIPIVFAELHDRIIGGCKDLFMRFSQDRILIKDRGEKYLSISRTLMP